jgi:HTH-type transcriptional regulator / antitoxin HigA
MVARTAGNTDAKKRGSAAKPSGKTRIRTAAVRRADPDYLNLVRRFSLRPIRTDAELDAAAGVIDELTNRNDLSQAESDYERYEDTHVEMPPVSDAEMLRSLMDDKGVRQADVVRGTGISKTVLSLILHGKRDLTRAHIRALSKYFGVHPASFLGPA